MALVAAACLVMDHSIVRASETSAVTNEQGCVRQRGGPQDPGMVPPPVMDACLGPYSLHIPANYFDDQMGPNFDGSFGLYLEYPELTPFAPGERTHLTLDVATRTVNIGYDYLDRVSIEEFMQRQTLPVGSGEDAPEMDIQTRIKGEEIDGLTPYYANIAAYRAHYLAKGLKPSNSIMDASYYKDWYVNRDAQGRIETIIKCTSHEVKETGVEYRDGKLVRSNDRMLPECEHTFVIPEMNAAIKINYVRFAFKDWKKIQERARSVLQGLSRAADFPRR